MDYAALRLTMVDTQLSRRGITDERVLAAMASIPREEFVPEEFRHEAYEDNPLPIGSGQTISQPYMVAKMTELLRLKPNDKVLEIGTGCGYQTAVLASLAGEVYSVEIVPELHQFASRVLTELGYDNVRLMLGDGSNGWPEFSPYTGIIVTAAEPFQTPEAFLNQLDDPGRLVIPVGMREQKLYFYEKESGRTSRRELFDVRFVPLVRAH